jgi:hypothetical protein
MTNPYPDEHSLLFWHDLWKQRVEEYNEDWRDQSAWVNEHVPEFRSFNPERNQRPWLALKAAYEAKCAELEAALQQLKTLEALV